MKRLVLLAVFLLPLFVTSAQESAEDRYIAIYDLIQGADKLNEAPTAQEALTKYREAQADLQTFQKQFPGWNTKIVNFRLNYLSTKIHALESVPVEGGAAARKTAPSGEVESSLKTLQEQLREAQAEKVALENKLKEAQANQQTTSADLQRLAQAEDKVQSLQRENDSLKSELVQRPSKPAEPLDTALLERIKQSLDDARRKLDEQSKAVVSLTEEKNALQKRLELLGTDTGARQVVALQAQLRQAEADKAALQAKLDEVLAAKSSAVGLAEAQEKIRALQKENTLLRASLEQQQAASISAADSAAALEQARNELAETNRKLQQQKELAANLARENEDLQKRLDALARGDSMAVELQQTKKELVALKRRFAIQTEAAVVLLSEANIKINRQTKGAAATMQQMDALKKQLAEQKASTEMVAMLQAENEVLKKQLAEAREQTLATGAVGEANAILTRAQTQLSSFRARLDVLEAKAVPYTAEELALFRKPESTHLAATEGAKRGEEKLSPRAVSLVKEAQQLFADHQLEKAEEKYLEVLKLDGKNVGTLANLATIELELNRPEEADKYVKQALAVDANDAFSLGVLGNLRFRQGKYDEAMDALSRAAQLNPNDAEIQNFLGVTLSQKGLRGPAETALRKAIQLEPDYGSAHNNLAVVYITQDPPQVELARWHYKKALDAGQPHNPDLERLMQEADKKSEKK